MKVSGQWFKIFTGKITFTKHMGCCTQIYAENVIKIITNTHVHKHTQNSFVMYNKKNNKGWICFKINSKLFCI